MVYLDNAATTFPKSESVYSAMDKANRELAFNAGRGAYKAARAASRIIDETKTRLASLMDAEGYADVVLTPSVTHALNQVLRGIRAGEGDLVYVSPYEHNAVARTAHAICAETGAKLRILPLTDDLTIDIEKAAYLFSTEHPSVVVMNALSNVTGYVLPVSKVFALAKQYGAVTVADAAQAAGLLDLDMKSIHADIICFAAHKSLNGPLGAAGFLIRKGLTLEKSFFGGTGSDSLNLSMPDASPARYEAASVNIVAVAGLLASLREVDVEQHLAKVLSLTQYLLEQLQEIPSVHVLGAYEPGNTLGIVSFAVDGYQSDEIGSILDSEFDIAVRTGYHCAPFIHDYLNDRPYAGTVRVSVGQFNEKSDIDALISALETL